MRVLVCGGRNYVDIDKMNDVLSRQHRVVSFTHLIHGSAPGADSLADCWARENGIQRVVCPADWQAHGKAAGPIRNRRMLELQPDLVIAFPGGAGTANMVTLATEANIQILRITDI